MRNKADKDDAVGTAGSGQKGKEQVQPSDRAAVPGLFEALYGGITLRQRRYLACLLYATLHECGMDDDRMLYNGMLVRYLQRLQVTLEDCRLEYDAAGTSGFKRKTIFVERHLYRCRRFFEISANQFIVDSLESQP